MVLKMLKFSKDNFYLKENLVLFFIFILAVFFLFVGLPIIGLILIILLILLYFIYSLKEYFISQPIIENYTKIQEPKKYRSCRY